MNAPLRIGIAGLGTVGRGVVKLLTREAERLDSRAGRPLRLVAVSARDRGRDRGIALGGYAWFDDPVALARSDEVDVVVELIGGESGTARAVVEAALAAGKHVVTANKALIAHRGTALAAAAEEAGAALNFEAAVAGGIPIVKAIREGLAGNRIGRVYGILNGTCNYILTQMQETGRDFDEVLREAQALGYAEADPAFDIDGIDAAHKLSILASLAFGCPVDFPSVYVEGIRHVEAVDIAFAHEFNFRIKLLAIARLTGHGLEQRVHPCMVPERAAIAEVDGVFNAVVVQGDFIGPTIYEGRGAGEGPTASAVVADLLDIACGAARPAFAVPARDLAAIPSAPMDRHVGRYYVRLTVVDRAGVIADIATILRDENISIESLLQRGRAPAPGEAVPVVLLTHDTEEAAMVRALRRMADLDVMLQAPKMLRMETP